MLHDEAPPRAKGEPNLDMLRALKVHAQRVKWEATLTTLEPLAASRLSRIGLRGAKVQGAGAGGAAGGRSSCLSEMSSSSADISRADSSS